MLAKLMSKSEIEPNTFDNDKTLYPVLTRSQEEFDNLHPLSIQQIAKEQLIDNKLIKEMKKKFQ